MENRVDKVNHLYFKVFVSSYVIFLIWVLPFVILSGGLYNYIGDYNIQMITFWEHINKLWKSGIPAYDMLTDIGLNYAGSYSFYGLTSPFTFLSLVFPEKVLPYGITFINAFKFSVAALGACLYCKQYVKKDNSVFCCGIMYAFCGPQIFNLVFHFSDSIAVFPFLLLAFDKLVKEKKSLYFALMLAIAGFTNYFFLFSECLFILIYFIVRIISKDFKIDLKLFLKIAVETVLGISMCAIILCVSFACISNNSRAGDKIFSDNLIAYGDGTTYLKIIQSMFLIPDICNTGFITKNDAATDNQLHLASVSLYIPLFTIICVIAVWKKHKNSWYTKLLKVCAVIAVVPLFNSAFTLFSQRYYARWFYMPLLIMIVMTGKYIDNAEIYDIKKEIKLSLSVLTVIFIYGSYRFILKQVTDLIALFYFIVIIALLSLGLLYSMIYGKKESSINIINIKQIICIFSAVSLVGMSLSILNNSLFTIPMTYVERETNCSKGVKIDDESFFRITNYTKDDDLITKCSNAAIRFGYPSVMSFHSLVPESTSEFYNALGIVRLSSNITVGSADYPLFSFLSVKYNMFYNMPLTGGIEVDPEDVQFYVPGYNISDIQNKYIIYKNDNYIPMGFTYDYYVNINEIKEIYEKKGFMEAEDRYNNKGVEMSTQDKEKLLLKGIWLDEGQILKYSDILEELPENKFDDLSDVEYEKDCAERRETSAYEFLPTKDGFVSKINLDKRNLVFYSVPYDDSFTAYVDGKETVIEKVFDGLCAVEVPEGDHCIEFKYTVPGLRVGMLISISGVMFFMIYSIICIKNIKQNKGRHCP